jgi:hypothetical protein
MQTSTFNSGGLTNPSKSTLVAYHGDSNSLPPAAGGGLSNEAELSTTDYSNCVYKDHATPYIFTGNPSFNYSGVRFEFIVPFPIIRQVKNFKFFVLNIDVEASNGYTGFGVNFYVKNNLTNSWESFGSSGAWLQVTSTTTGGNANISKYFDSTGRLKVLIMNNQVFDANGSGCQIFIANLGLTLSYFGQGQSN